MGGGRSGTGEVVLGASGVEHYTGLDWVDILGNGGGRGAVLGWQVARFQNASSTGRECYDDRVRCRSIVPVVRLLWTLCSTILSNAAGARTSTANPCPKTGSGKVYLQII